MLETASTFHCSYSLSSKHIFWYSIHNTCMWWLNASNLILESDTSKGPDTGKDKVQLIQLLGTVWGRVLWGQQTFQQVTQHLDVTVVCYRCDLLEASAHRLQTHRNVLVKEDGQIGSLWLDLSLVNPALGVSEIFRVKREWSSIAHNCVDWNFFSPTFYRVFNAHLNTDIRSKLFSCCFKQLSDKIWLPYGIQPRSWGLMNKIPALDTVAGVAVLKWLISNNSLMEGVRGIRSLLASVSTLLSSMTVFRDSIHIGSMSPSRTIHLGPSPDMLARSRIITENKPVNNIHCTGNLPRLNFCKHKHVQILIKHPYMSLWYIYKKSSLC